MDMKIDLEKIIKNIKKFKNYANINLLGCYNVLFSKKGVSKNIGAFLIIAIIIFHLICIKYFILCEIL